MDNGAGKIWIIEDASKESQNAATFSKHADKVDKVFLAINDIRVVKSICEDYNNGTTRNTVETVASIAGGYLGGYAGGLGGAAVGTVILPGMGTIVGQNIGSFGGGIAGSLGARAAAETIGDALDYDVEEKVCDKCGKKFKVRKYKGERSQICPKCDPPMDRKHSSLGGLGGAAVGTVILIGIGTIVGCTFGRFGGGIAGSLGAMAAAETIDDALDYDVEEKVGDECGKKFKVR